LIDLSRFDISSFISLESSVREGKKEYSCILPYINVMASKANMPVRVTGSTSSHEDPLQGGRLSYLKPLKPWPVPLRGHEGLEEGCLDVDDPEWRRIVEESFEQYLRHPTDASTKLLDVYKLKTSLQQSPDS
jgi:hypothetical protein